MKAWDWHYLPARLNDIKKKTSARSFFCWGWLTPFPFWRADYNSNLKQYPQSRIEVSNSAANRWAPVTLRYPKWRLRLEVCHSAPLCEKKSLPQINFVLYPQLDLTILISNYQLQFQLQPWLQPQSQFKTVPGKSNRFFDFWFWQMSNPAHWDTQKRTFQAWALARSRKPNWVRYAWDRQRVFQHAQWENKKRPLKSRFSLVSWL